MKFPWLAVGIVPALTVPVVWAQHHTAEASKADGRGRLVHVEPRPADDGADSQNFDRAAWRKRLTDGDLDQRLQAFDELTHRARRDQAAHAAIESWAHEAGNAELSWTCRLLLRETDSHPPRPDGPWGGQWGGPAFGGALDWKDLQSRFDELQQQFGGMDSMFGDLQAELDRMRHDSPPNPGLAPFGAWGGISGSSSAQSFTLQVGPDGVTCRVHENVDGKDETKEYKADNLEDLLDAHPELRGRIHGGQDGFGWGGPLSADGSSGRGGSGRLGPVPGAAGQRDPLDRLARTFSGTPRTDIFGVEFSKLAPEKVKELNLEPERGLSVQRTVPGTIAQILGVKRGDLLIEMNGTPLFSGDDVSRVLRERAPQAELVVTLIDGKGQRRSLTWKPSTDGQQGESTPRATTPKGDESRKP